MEQIYENIRNRRIELNMSQEELAKKTGYTDRSSIAKIESGKVDITITKAKEFASALDIDILKLLGWEEQNG